MKKSLLFEALKVIVVFGLIWLIATYLPFFKSDKGGSVSHEKEEEIGDYIVAQIEKDSSFQVYKNAIVDSAIDIIEARLTDSTVKRNYNYQIIVFDNKMVNAFSIPGGYILVSKGLLNFVDSPEELAGVLAHEMGHIEKQHIIKKIIKEFGLAILTKGDRYALGEVSKTLTSTGFDRKQEKEADNYAFELLEKTNINPHVMASFFRRIIKPNDESEEKLDFLSTHPNSTARMRAALEYTVKPSFREKKINIDWNKVKASLKK